MQKKSFRKICALLLSVALMCGILPMSVMADDSEMPEVSYVDENGSTRYTTEYELLTGEETEITEGTYVARGNINYPQRMNIVGNVTIIIDEYVYEIIDEDTKKFAASSFAATGGFHVPATSSLKVYSSKFNYCSDTPSFSGWNTIPAQCAGIGGNQGEANGPITIVGVSGTVFGGFGAAGIGTGGCGNGNTVSDSDPYLSSTGAGSIILCNSSFTCIGGYSAASIGGGFHADSPNIYLTDCGIGAYTGGGYDAAGIGGGAGGQCGIISISGGNLTALARGGDDARGAAIGNGYGCPNPDYSKCQVSISGADVDAISSMGSGLICSASDNIDSISSDAYYVDPAMSIQMVEMDGNNISSRYYTKDVKKCIEKSPVYMKVCKHEHATYECTSQGHLMHCPDCRTAFSQEIHHYGGATNVCKECGYGADALLSSATVVFEGNLKLRYTFTFSSRLLEDENAYVSFTSYNTGAELLRVKIKDGTQVGEKTQIMYPFEITDYDQKTIMNVYNGQGQKVSLHSGNNVDYTETGVAYSPSLYATNVRNFTYTTSAMQRFAIAFLDYGEAARNLFKGNPYSNLGQLDVDMPGDDLLEPYAPSFDGTRPEDISRVTLRMYYEDIHTLRVTFYFKEGVNPDDYVFKLDGQPVKAIKTSTGGYAIEVSNISAPNMAYEYAFGIAKRGEADYTINASGLSYAWTSWHTNDEYYKALGKGMYFYYKAATDYIAIRDGAGQ